MLLGSHILSSPTQMLREHVFCEPHLAGQQATFLLGLGGCLGDCVTK